MNIRFLGAAQTVTGSSYHLRSGETELLIDAGMFQGPKNLRRRNWDAPPLDPRSISATLLTHAHIDHTGYLPKFVRDGLNCPVYCTGGTRDLTGVLLADSARLQEEEAEYHNKHNTSRHFPAKPLFDQKDVLKTYKLLEAHRYNKPFEVVPGWTASFNEAGHILGSSWIDLRGRGKRFIFSGDLGRGGSPILRDAKPPTGVCDVLVLESTYGDRQHARVDIEENLALTVARVAKRGGTLVIPAFAVERTQEIVYLLEELVRAKDIPSLPVFIDSPMAVRATKLFHRYENYYDQEAQELIEDGKNVLGHEKLRLCESVQDSKNIAQVEGPKIIVSASGMATGGRVLHHLKHYLPDPKNHVLLVGYQADETRGSRLENGAEEIKIFGQSVPVRAEVSRLEGLSGHADGSEVIKWASHLKKPPKITFLVHGEPKAIQAQSQALENLGWAVKAPQYLQDIQLDGEYFS